MTTASTLLANARRMPLVAILRGLDPAQAVDIGHALVGAGFRAIEVPLNRPGALACIHSLTSTMPADVLVGGGTMLSTQDVDAVYAAGGRLMVSPNCNEAVIRRAAGLGMLCAPGVLTPTEAFAALHAGAHALKLFPAEVVGTGGAKALQSVLPAGTELWPVGGITPDSMPGWIRAGASGFGIGSQLFTPALDAAEVHARALRYVAAWHAARATSA